MLDFFAPLLPFAISVLMMVVALFIPALNRSSLALGVYMVIVLAVSVVGSFIWI